MASGREIKILTPSEEGFKIRQGERMMLERIRLHQEKLKRLNLELFEAVSENNTKRMAYLIRQGAVVAPEYRYGICLLPGEPLLLRL